MDVCSKLYVDTFGEFLCRRFQIVIVFQTYIQRTALILLPTVELIAGIEIGKNEVVVQFRDIGAIYALDEKAPGAYVSVEEIGRDLVASLKLQFSCDILGNDYFVPGFLVAESW